MNRRSDDIDSHKVITGVVCFLAGCVFTFGAVEAWRMLT